MTNCLLPFLTACMLALGGCLNPTSTRNVTKETKFQVGYTPGQVYWLKVDQALVDSRTDDGKRSFVYPYPQSGAWVSLKEPGTCYLARMDTHSSDVIGTVPAGSRVQVERLEYQTYVTLSDVDRFVVAYGRLLDSPFAGRLVALTEVSELIDVPNVALAARAQSPLDSLIERVPE